MDSIHPMPAEKAGDRICSFPGASMREVIALKEEKKDLYEVLGLKKGATDAEIKKA